MKQIDVNEEIIKASTNEWSKYFGHIPNMMQINQTPEPPDWNQKVFDGTKCLKPSNLTGVSKSALIPVSYVYNKVVKTRDIFHSLKMLIIKHLQKSWWTNKM